MPIAIFGKPSINGFPKPSPSSAPYRVGPFQKNDCPTMSLPFPTSFKLQEGYIVTTTTQQVGAAGPYPVNIVESSELTKLYLDTKPTFIGIEICKVATYPKNTTFIIKVAIQDASRNTIAISTNLSFIII
jgi:hypothetical protein